MRAATLVACLGLCACIDASTVERSDVIELEVCPEGARCARVADGRGHVTVRACVPEAVIDRKGDLPATLRVSSGRWSAPDDPARPQELALDLGADRCASPSFVTGTTLDPVRVDATLAEMRAFEWIALEAAPLVGVDVTPTPKVLPEGAGEVALAAAVRARSGGMPTQGTRVTFAVVDSTPAGAAALVYPEESIVDGADARATLVVYDEVEAVTVRVTATPPVREGETPAEPVTRDVPLRAKTPADEGTGEEEGMNRERRER